MPVAAVEVAAQIYVFHGPPVTVAGPLPTMRFVEIASCVDGYPDPNPQPGDVNCGQTWTPVSTMGAANLMVTSAAPVLALRSLLDASGFALNPWAGRQRIYTRPLRHSGPLFVPLPLGSSLDYVAGSLEKYASDRGVVLVNQVDCLGTLAAAKIELPETPEAQRTTMLAGESHPEQEYFHNAFFVNVPTTLTKVSSSLRDGRQVSARAVLAARGWFTTVTLYPLSSQE
jgi:hypothetical protein